MLWDFLAQSVRASHRGNRPAVVTDEAIVTYTELLARADALSARLRAVGVGPGNVVLAYLENEPAFLVALLAVARLGCAFAPLDIGMTDAEIAGIVELTRSDLVVTDPRGSERCALFSSNVVCIDVRGEPAEAPGEARERTSVSAPRPSLAPSVGCMQFSSGTTAASKGILLSHEAFFYRSHFLMRALGLTEADRTLCTLPLSHTHGAECLALPTLLAGGTLYLKSPKFSFPLYILEEIERHRVTFFSSIPQFYDFAVKLGAGNAPDLRSLRLPFCGSAALAKTTAEAFFAKYGVHIKQGYGLAELSVICMNMHDGGVIAYDSVGKPIDGIEWRLLGGENEREGELVVRSKATFSGYINGEEATREKLRDGWLYTGDIVTIDEQGLFRIVGRKEDFIKVNGFKVYASEVETAIIGLPWVKECAVLAEKDPLGAERTVAHIVPSDWTRSAEAMQAALARDLRAVVSDYKVPKRCVAWRELPKSPLGKILKSKIRMSQSNGESPS
jgi:long-chain acyl-CoA synthetase